MVKRNAIVFPNEYQKYDGVKLLYLRRTKSSRVCRIQFADQPSVMLIAVLSVSMSAGRKLPSTVLPFTVMDFTPL